MATFEESSERESFSNVVRKQNKYGSTSRNSLTSNDTFIDHIVTESDTLQGIALRYEVSMEKIKRANNLWTSDSLFLRTSLRIPVPPPELCPSTSTSSTTCDITPILNSNHRVVISSNSSAASGRTKHSTSNSNTVNCDDTNLASETKGKERRKGKLFTEGNENCAKMSNSGSRRALENGTTSFTTKKGTPPMAIKSTAGGATEESANDFLIRIDGYIARSKDNMNSIMQQRAKLTNTYSDEDLFKLRNKTTAGYLKRHSPRNSSIGSLEHLAMKEITKPTVVTRSRKVRTSIKRLEEQQDELFEL